MQVFFDTFSKSKTGMIFDEAFKSISLTQFMKEKNINRISKCYRTFIDGLAKKYKEHGKSKDFPLFGLKNISPSGQVFFEQELPQETSDFKLNHIAFLTRYTMQDDIMPLESKESWELFRRPATFWASNPNK